MFAVGILVHVTFLFSIFDIYFKSPIVRNVIPYRPQHEAVADRLVLLIVDGLRAESFVNYTTMPYLRSVANTYGRWGISNTQVPTESRPGHVAVIAGFYEDPSAVLKGWKENPVDFDSVFNQTLYTWCWGAYDIVNIFTKGLTDDHITIHDFDPYEQSFSTDKNTTLLDAWVFNNVQQFFDEAKYNITVNERLKESKIAFFLHLLGTDTSGHTHKPKTKNFLTTVGFVDEGIKNIEQVIRDHYNDDGKTTFIMTSDHGMTDWGSHGSGDDHETQTPFVIWGAGVQQVKAEEFDPQTLNMSLNHRFDINQVNLTPLMSTILSIPVPVNSIGQVNTELLNMSLPNKAKAIYSNCRQLASQYNMKRQEVENNSIAMLYQPYKAFSKEKYDEIIASTEKLLSEGEYEKLILLSEQIMHLSLLGLKYYHNYYQRPLLILVTLSFLGWIACLLKILIEQKRDAQVRTSNIQKPKMPTFLENMLLYFCCCLSSYLVYAQNLPLQYIIYMLMPIFLWWYALSSSQIWLQAVSQLKRNRNILKLFIEVSFYSLGSIAMGLSFTYRWMLSFPLLGMALWPFFSSKRHQLSKTLLFVWSTGCLSLSLFSFMPVVGKDVFIELVMVAGLIWLIILVLYILKVLLPLYWETKVKKDQLWLMGFQIGLLLSSLYNIYKQRKRFEQGTPVSNYEQTFTWMSAGHLFIIPWGSPRRLICRLIVINTSILIFYLLLSVSHEGLFMVALILNVSCWILIEFRLLHLGNKKIIDFIFDEYDTENINLIPIQRGINSQDFRRGFFFVLYIILAFFGTGNIASINSFEVKWVTCFTTSYQPFVITTLILLKTLCPFFIVACSFRAVEYLSMAPSSYLNIIVLIYSNLMGIQLLYNVRNTGSWLEIGMSISQFVIVQVITLFIVVINQMAKIVTDFGD